MTYGGCFFCLTLGVEVPHLFKVRLVKSFSKLASDFFAELLEDVGASLLVVLTEQFKSSLRLDDALTSVPVLVVVELVVLHSVGMLLYYGCFVN
mgnify:CR=1 FL=1